MADAECVIVVMIQPVASFNAGVTAAVAATATATVQPYAIDVMLIVCL